VPGCRVRYRSRTGQRPLDDRAERSPKAFSDPGVSSELARAMAMVRRREDPVAEQDIEMSRCFRDAAATLTEQMRQMNDIEAQLRAEWPGRSSNALTAAMDQWEGHFTTIIKELTHMIEVAGGQNGVEHVD
jgi:uncharacterized protein YukE